MLGLDAPQLVEQRVVLVVADLRVVEDVIAVAVMLELRAQLSGALARIGRAGAGRGGTHGSATSSATSSITGAATSSVTSSAAGAISRCRS